MNSKKINIIDIKNEIYGAKASNRNPIYDSHIYWSQKPYNICDILINAFSVEGDVVFDPFLGSGVTLLQAVSKNNKRKAVGCEINDAPLFIIETLLKHYDIKNYNAVAEEFLSQIKKLQRYYFTKCPKCGAKGVITSVVFDKKTRSSAIEIKSINYRCTCSAKLTKKPDEDDIWSINVEHHLQNIEDMQLIPNTKIAVYDNETISQIFTKRNFAVLDQIVGIINRLSDYNALFRYLFMSVIHLCKITDKHSNSQWPLWIPKTDCVEKNIIDLIDRKISRFASTIKYLGANYSKAKDYKLLHKGSQYITEEDIPNDSVQLIITDPPYLGQVIYSEYMQLYKPFLGLNFNLEDEIVVSSAPSRKKNEENYFILLSKVFSICSDKLKENGYLCLYFHDSNLDVWEKLVGILADSHFRYLSQAHIAKSNTLKNIISPKKSLNGDCILFFIKDSGTKMFRKGSESLEDVEKNIIRQAKFLVRQNTSLSTPELYDKGLMEILIQNGWLSTLAQKYKSLVDIFEKHLYWDSETSKWSIKKGELS